MAFKHGKSAAITVNSVALGTYCDSETLDIAVDTAETTTFGVNWKTHVPGLAGATLKITGNYDPVAVTGPVAVFTGLIGNVGFPVVVEPGGNVAGQIRHSFTAIITGYSENTAVADKITFAADILVTGIVTTITIP